VLVVRIHNSAMNAGIHQPVRVYLPPRQFGDACDGAALDETFADTEPGGIPEGWKRHVQERDGQVFGLAEVSRHFVRTPTLHLRDQRSHVVVWSASDEVLPPGDHWAVQFDFRLTGRLCYKAADCGALFGLKRGEPGSADFLPLVQVDNDETPGGPVRLLGLGQVLTEDLATDQWHRLVIHRRGTDWDVYLDEGQRGRSWYGLSRLRTGFVPGLAARGGGCALRQHEDRRVHGPAGERVKGPRARRSRADAALRFPSVLPG